MVLHHTPSLAYCLQDQKSHPQIKMLNWTLIIIKTDFHLQKNELSCDFSCYSTNNIYRTLEWLGYNRNCHRIYSINILTMVKEKDKTLFTSVLDSHKGIIYKIAKAYSADEEDHKDLMQEIIVQIWNSFERYNNQYKYSTWIYRIALNVAITVYRKNSLRRSKSIPLTDNATNFSDEETNEKEQDIQLLYKVIHGLSNLDRALMLLHLEQKNYSEIAEIMELTETNVATKLSRIKKVIKNKFSQLKNY